MPGAPVWVGQEQLLQKEEKHEEQDHGPEDVTDSGAGVGTSSSPGRYCPRLSEGGGGGGGLECCAC